MKPEHFTKHIAHFNRILSRLDQSVCSTCYNKTHIIKTYTVHQYIHENEGSGPDQKVWSRILRPFVLRPSGIAVLAKSIFIRE